MGALIMALHNCQKRGDRFKKITTRKEEEREKEREKIHVKVMQQGYNWPHGVIEERDDNMRESLTVADNLGGIVFLFGSPITARGLLGNSWGHLGAYDWLGWDRDTTWRGRREQNIKEKMNWFGGLQSCVPPHITPAFRLKLFF